MAYNYGPPPGAYNTRQPSYGYPGPGGPPHMGAPPGMDAAPGMTAPSPAGQQQFQPPPNMPNINFNAPVIRLGVQDQQKSYSPADRGQGRDAPRGSNAEPLGRRDRAGLGAGGGDPRNIDRDRAAVRESMQATQPPTREEVYRTIFVGGLGAGAPDDTAIENLLRCAGKLRRWTRARDADDKICKFGFAEFEDWQSLEAANEIFVDVEVPLFKNGSVVKDEESGEVKKMALLVVVDEQSKDYIEEWKGKRREDDNARQFRMDSCKEDLAQCLTSLSNTGAFNANATNGQADGEDTAMTDANGEKGDNAEVVTIPLSLEDELSDIPAEMRATVAEEIKAFRDRSTRRDLERMRREDEMEQAERQRSGRINRLASPPPSGAPSGPAGATNGIPVGPRDRSGVQGAPAGPRGYRGAQMPSDYVNGVNFVGANGTANGISLNREDEDAPESDDELERRRQEKKSKDLEQEYLAAERRWQTRETQRAAAQERTRKREEEIERAKQRQKEEMAKKLREWDDDEEARRGADEYYHDRSAWLRKRAVFRDREARDDEMDREEEAREKAEERRKVAEARGMADTFMDQMGSELSARAAEHQPTAASVASGFKMSLGSAAARTKAAQAAAATQSAPKRAMADVEGLLEDEEDAAASGLKKTRPELKPLPTTFPSQDMTDTERATARQNLASEIPTNTDDLFAYPLQYSHLTKTILDEQIRPFVEKKVVEYLGVQEDLLVDAVVEGLEARKGPRAIVGVLEEALDGEEALVLVRKVWRLCVFWAECGGRGLL
ncbi:hypothetical protein LTR37_019149 [Vermiconidia calcicola]|uniref:Uncharacterized protein n=1 Tax=Vermiconidia calcicola TaxID=1690605 RepID=A0ACC3MEV3_9PEZI|nr:hypothetical protein LTR37_019149 [Vermiconidia calcicola]